MVGDGWEGLPDRAPFDAINVAAATARGDPVRRSRNSSRPAGGWWRRSATTDQYLILAQRTPEGIVRAKLEAVRFVPLVPGPG